MKKVLFLAPSKAYAKTVVKNTCEELDKKHIGYGTSESDDYLGLKTDNVLIEFNWEDPIRWTAKTFYKLDAVFGKKEIIEKAKEKMFHLGAMFPKTSFINYILDAEAKPDTEIRSRETYIPQITKVHFNGPMTIVLWDDGTKTMVKCQDDDWYSEEVGLAMCIAKKAMGNTGAFNKVFQKWIPETKAMDIDISTNLNVGGSQTIEDILNSIVSKFGMKGGASK